LTAEVAREESRQAFALLRPWELGVVKAFSDRGQKITAIKMARSFSACGLHAAKLMVEELVMPNAGIIQARWDLASRYEVATSHQDMAAVREVCRDLEASYPATAPVRRIPPGMPDLED
jgi:hypothetical protein